jgi:site-specific recombinase XerD
MIEPIRIDHGSFESGKRNIPRWKVPKAVKAELLRFLDDLGLGKVNRGKRISPARQLKYLHALRAPLEFFNKPTHRLTLRDIENLERALASGELANHFTGKPFAHSTQVDIRMLLKIFLRWRLGPVEAECLAGWLDTRPRPNTPDFLKEAEVERLHRHCRTAEQKFLIAVLFDAGARAEEFHNIRCEDIYLPEGQENYVKIALKEEYSKTLGRTIALYWSLSLQAVREYLAERRAEGIKPTEPVFRGNYAATRKFLQRLGHRVLQRPVYYHLFRHSSATHYATKLNRQELCYRYGWRFSSNMPDVYISRAGMETKNLDEKFAQTELGTLKNELAKVEQAAGIKDNRIRQLEDSVRLLQQNLEVVSRALSVNPTIQDLESALQRKRKSVTDQGS